EISAQGPAAHPSRAPVSPRRAVDDVGVARRTHRRRGDGAYRRQARVTGRNRLHGQPVEEGSSFLRKPRFSRRNHDHLRGPGPPCRQSSARDGREDRNQILHFVGGETHGTQWPYPRCQDDLRDPMAGSDAATGTVEEAAGTTWFSMLLKGRLLSVETRLAASPEAGRPRLCGRKKSSPSLRCPDAKPEFFRSLRYPPGNGLAHPEACLPAIQCDCNP